MSAGNASPRYRAMRFGVTRGVLTERAGCQFLKAEAPLDESRVSVSMAHALQRGNAAHPERTLFARREAHVAPDTPGTRPGDGWHLLSYHQAWGAARSIANKLIDMGLSAERPVAIISENSIEHALMALGCMVAGVPYAPISPAYSLQSQDFGKLKHCLSLLTPGLVFAQDEARYGKALAAVDPVGASLVFAINNIATNVQNAPTYRQKSFKFTDFTTGEASAAVDAAMAAVTPQTIAKFLFTSGSTKLPKAVVNTQRMWCANQQQMRQSMPLIDEEPPVLVDWLPWNHTFGGNHNFGMALDNGGTLYIDDGKPLPALMPETLRNLREIAPTAYFNVPTGFEAIARAMQGDDADAAALRKNLLSRVKMFFYAGAALAQPVWNSLFASEEREIGERIVMGTGLGMTESSPFGLFVTNPNVRAGDLGLPTPGMELKLVPTDGKVEVRYRGPNITPGYWRMPEVTADGFDEEGFFKTGDAVAWIDPDNIHLGLRFDGRIAEDFKLATGTFVSVGPLRAKIIAACAPYVQDAVITGLNRHEVGALLFPTPAVRALAGLGANTPLVDVLAHPRVVEHLQRALNALAAGATGSASRVTRFHALEAPPNIDLGEITDKGSINQRAVLQHRDALVEALYTDALPRTLKPQAPQTQ